MIVLPSWPPCRIISIQLEPPALVPRAIVFNGAFLGGSRLVSKLQGGDSSHDLLINQAIEKRGSLSQIRIFKCGASCHPILMERQYASNDSLKQLQHAMNLKA